MRGCMPGRAVPVPSPGNYGKYSMRRRGRAPPRGGGGGGQGDRAFVPVHDPEPEGRLPDERRHDGFCVALPFLLFLLVCRRHAP